MMRTEGTAPGYMYAAHARACPRACARVRGGSAFQFCHRARTPKRMRHARERRDNSSALTLRTVVQDETKKEVVWQ